MRRLVIVLLAAAAALLAHSDAWAQPADDRDCADFATQEEAQEFFDQAGGDDPHDLDPDNDGVACETIASQGGTTPVPTAVATAAPTGDALPNNGGPEMLFGLSGVGLLGAGSGLRRIYRNLRELDELEARATIAPPQMPVYRAAVDRASRDYR